MYLEEYLRQYAGQRTETGREGEPVVSAAADFGRLLSDPGLEEIWGLYLKPAGKPCLKRIGRRAGVDAAWKIEI
ncbi:MAG: hypothetical protein IKT15_02330 [Firmicutes bacterium]|jgi:hypothetical protein|nr:hypothetical protein [Bacillota bacterium]